MVYKVYMETEILRTVLLGGGGGGGVGRMFGGSLQFLFVFYRPDRREYVRSESRMVFPTYTRTLSSYIYS